ncbi:MAG: SdpI family protein [Lachnospiraceae bacterium]|nr:SdpI family protein [Lachnospiraceae bacterium]
MKKIMWFFGAVSVIGTLFMMKYLPDTVPMHFDSQWKVDRWGSKYELFLLPVIMLVGCLLFTVMLGFMNKRSQDPSEGRESVATKVNAKSLARLGAAMMAFFTVMQGGILYMCYKSGPDTVTAPFDLGRLLCIMMGLLFIVMGNITSKTKENGLIGIRTSFTRYNEVTWRKSNFFGGIALMIAGALSVVIGLIIKDSIISMSVAVGLLILATAISLIYAYKIYLSEKKSGKSDLGTD